MNLRFVFSLIVSLLSLLPTAAQDLTRNWIRERIFLDAEGKKCVTSVQYFDGIGRETLLLTDGLSPAGGVAGALTGESFAGRTSAKWLPATGLTGFDFLTPERVKSLAVSSHEGDRKHTETTAFDANGNITRLVRWADYAPMLNTAADVLYYTLDGNRPLSISDRGVNLAYAGSFDFKNRGRSGEYAYDGNGRLVSDPYKGMTVTYADWGTPEKITFDDGNHTAFTYTASGEKLKTEWRSGAANLRAGEGSVAVQAAVINSEELFGPFVCRDGRLDKFLFDGGFCDLSSGGAKYRYFVRDRLGSVRSVADEDGNVLQQNLYYAWGGAWGDVCTAPGFQSYKYCGKYLDRKHGLDLYDYGARLYDPAAAFWTSPDPLCEKYYNISPYAFCNDNPVTFIDPDGRDPGDPFTSLDNAALDFCRIFNYWSMTRNPGYPYGAEYASVFYSYKDKEDNIRYSYYVSEPEKATTCTIKFDPKRIPNKRRESYHFVATGHTHGGYMPGYAGNYFSRIDIVSYYKGRKKYPTCNTAYLATTNGTFMKCIYRKNIDKWMVYSFKGGKYQLPSDANDPTHNKYTYQLITEKFYSTKKFYEIFKSLSKYLGKGEYFK